MEQAGTPLNCGQCGTPNAPGARFCANCGSSLSSNSHTATQPPPPSLQPHTFYSDTASNPYPVTSGTPDQPYGPLPPPPPPPDSPYGSSTFTETPPAPPPNPSKTNRRTFLIGAGVVVGLAAAGTGVYLLTQSGSRTATLTLNFT